MNGIWNGKLITEVVVIALFMGGGYWYLSGGDTTAESKSNGPAVSVSALGAPLSNGEPVPQTPVGVTAIVSEPGTSREFLSNQLIVGFRIETSPEDAMKAIESVDGVMLQRFTNVPLFLISVPDEGDGATALRAMEKLKENAHVETVEPNYVTTLDSAAEGAGAEGSSVQEKAPATETQTAE